MPDKNALGAVYNHGVWGGVIWVEDQCPDGKQSVTNDAEAVVKAMVAAHGDKPIVYQDTLNQVDELQHYGPVFTCFHHLGGAEGCLALKRGIELVRKEHEERGR